MTIIFMMKQAQTVARSFSLMLQRVFSRPRKILQSSYQRSVCQIKSNEKRIYPLFSNLERTNVSLASFAFPDFSFSKKERQRVCSSDDGDGGAGFWVKRGNRAKGSNIVKGEYHRTNTCCTLGLRASGGTCL